MQMSAGISVLFPQTDFEWSIWWLASVISEIKKEDCEDVRIRYMTYPMLHTRTLTLNITTPWIKCAIHCHSNELNLFPKYTAKSLEIFKWWMNYECKTCGDYPCIHLRRSFLLHSERTNKGRWTLQLGKYCKKKYKMSAVRLPKYLRCAVVTIFFFIMRFSISQLFWEFYLYIISRNQ